jgi:hypothetical protein
VILTNINKFTLAVDDVTTVPLTEIRVRFVLDWQQLSTTDLTTPLYIVRKNAQAYCRLEDRLMLLGQGADPDQFPFPPPPGPGVVGVLGVPGVPGIPAVAGVPGVLGVVGAEVERGRVNSGLLGADKIYARSNDIYAGVAAGLFRLENDAVVGPWAIVMGTDLFDQADITQPGFVDSPRRRIESLLGTKAYRTSLLPKWTAILIGQAATAAEFSRSVEPIGPVDRAVALEPQLRFLRTDNIGRYEFMIVGSLALRVKDKAGIVQIQFRP